MKTKINKMILKTVGCVILAAPLVINATWEEPGCCNKRTGQRALEGTIDDARSLGAETDGFRYYCSYHEPKDYYYWVTSSENPYCYGGKTYKHDELGCSTGVLASPDLECGNPNS